MSIENKTIIITGANSGIGKETAKALASQGARIIMACRDVDRAKAAYDEIIEASKSDKVEILALDLASMRSIRTFAVEFQSKYPQLDILINNAGLFPLTKEMTEDGFEQQFGVNHLGHFLLTDLLLPQLEKAGNARVINVASMIHNVGKIDFDSFRGEKSYNAMNAYGQSKLANVLYTRELAKRYADKGITAYSLHPGGVATNIAGRSFFRRTLYRLLGGFLSAARGAKTSVYLATEADIEKHTGSYFNEFCKVKSGSKLSQDTALAERLWQESEKLIVPETV